MIKVNNLSKHFGENTVLDGITFDVKPGEILNIIGPSGCGKSTLLRILAGLETPDGGTLEMADSNSTLVFQYSALFDALTVFDNVAFTLLEPADIGPKRPLMKRGPDLKNKVYEALTFVGLDPDEVAPLYPSALSGGMQKRVSFARAIISQPRIVLYDEPTAGLDPLASEVIEDDIVKVRQQYQTTSVVVTHQLSTIMRTADVIMLLEEGHVAWLGSKADFMTTDQPLIQHFRQFAPVPT
jgi:phospholipid/cholesterol/gamma-HCH transport system ATP-binding protein